MQPVADQLDVWIHLAIRDIRNECARLAAKHAAWEPGPCPPDFGREPAARPNPRERRRWLRS